jgi:hypothetical protein
MKQVRLRARSIASQVQPEPPLTKYWRRKPPRYFAGSSMRFWGGFASSVKSFKQTRARIVLPLRKMNMKHLLLTLLLLPVLAAHAGRITLLLSDEQETDNAKICVYSNANFTETVTIRPSQQCRYTMTFED